MSDKFGIGGDAKNGQPFETAVLNHKIGIHSDITARQLAPCREAGLHRDVRDTVQGEIRECDAGEAGHAK